MLCAPTLERNAGAGAGDPGRRARRVTARETDRRPARVGNPSTGEGATDGRVTDLIRCSNQTERFLI